LIIVYQGREKRKLSGVFPLRPKYYIGCGAAVNGIAGPLTQNIFCAKKKKILHINARVLSFEERIIFILWNTVKCAFCEALAV
jgi:hypothetical protein